ncbi:MULTISPECIES: PspA/IM30 family protein [Deinococcus]|jgi:phage shock protein A|uniref:Phage shock protein A n=2 Tax=Deinococcus soli (ex Cha et al. 2016) TaxID=1309411 RepID=A0A0F7JNX3_9DEIO|nr:MULTISPECIES: PspA/IM30 family protein [Deinococcus]AKH16325.1 phage-shock protein [Deinococcus soli (ex Cha et al. 2016)]MDK2010791.1 PspA/IM30 family protein [Deinococcus sp. 43]MDR6216765.1 phage shock protein A [Deinococcus soli (ex Cha et al. 2016)]MDR6327586.1 phage shock protein A [Deinococcus soli (ex Cha et al. 2016)]MDR6749861.1 phage shock protein A [Deinococcus soli (ex Cha et al. 2016)]
MSILDRLSRLLRANVNDLISKAEDPGKIIEQALRDMRAAYAEARSEVADAMSQNAKLEREANTNRRMASEYEKKAEEALRGGSEDLAREALRRSQNAKDLAAGFEEQLQVQSGTVEQLKTQLRALEAKIDEMESKKSLLAARQKTAQAGATLDRVSGFDKAGGAMDAFEEMEQKVSGMEDRNRAMQDLRKENDFDAQLKDLGRTQALDDAMAALKAKVQGGGGSSGS